MMAVEGRDHGDGATEALQEQHAEAGLKEEQEEEHRLGEHSWTDPRPKGICWALSGYLKY
jgi:hypothetical protein